MNNNCLVFTDLDDTLFSTMRKQPEYKVEDCFVGTVKENGEPSGYLNPHQKAFFDRISSIGEIVPVTARVTEQLDRAVIIKGFKHAAWYQGALIKINNEIDKTWQDISFSILDSAQKDFENLYKSLYENSKFTDLHIILDRFDDLNNMAYQFYVERKEKNRKLISMDLLGKYIEDHLDLDKYYIHNQFDYISILPKEVNKAKAVKYIKEKLNPVLSIGCGDSDVDVTFMRECDYAIFPKKSLAFNEMYNTTYCK